MSWCWKRAQDGVSLQQVGERSGVGQVVDRYDLQVGISMGCAQQAPTNASESVDAELEHVRFSSRQCGAEHARPK